LVLKYVWGNDRSKPILRIVNLKQAAQGLTEYGLLLSLVTFVAVVGLGLFGGQLGNVLGTLLSDLGASV
jgi:Flp pilus assembly pilin Flp